MLRRAPERNARAPLAAAVAAAAVLVVAGCSDDDGEVTSQAVTTTSTTAETETTSTSTSASTTTTSSTTTTTTSAAPSTTVPFEGSTDRVEVPRPASTQEIVNHTSLDVSTVDGEERVTFTFDGGLPGAVAEYVDRPIRESGSGFEVDVDGDAVLAVRFEPASSARVQGEQVTRTYTGPDRVAGSGGTVTEVVRSGDFEALYEWVVGLDAEVPFRVETIAAAGTVTLVLPAG